MNTKNLSIVAAVAGTFCAAFAAVAYQSIEAAAAMPFAVGGVNDKSFWGPLSASLILWALACVGFSAHRRRRQKNTLNNVGIR